MKKPLACVRSELAEEEAGGVGKGGSETENFLKSLLGIQSDCFTRSRASRTFPGERRRLRKALLLIRNPHGDLAGVRSHIKRPKGGDPFSRRGTRHSRRGKLQEI